MIYLENGAIEVTEEERLEAQVEANRKNAETGCTCPIRAVVVNNCTFAASLETQIDYYDRFCPIHGEPDQS